jgi:heme/copper-type cytochrome/quinol oxidase subunit 1
VLIGINVFPVVGATYFWFPKFTGRMMDERLGRWNFWTMFLGFNLGFLPMHLSGLLGMPRRVYTYPEGMGWDTLNLITSIGSFAFAIGVLLFFINCWRSLRHGEAAGTNPWGAPTLEWSIPSPPPPYNFAVIPTVASRHPLWEDQLQESEGRSSLFRGMVLDHGKEALATTSLDADPERILEMPEDSYAPLLLAIGLSILFVGLLLMRWIVTGVGGGLVFLALLLWLWPRASLKEREPDQPEAAHG